MPHKLNTLKFLKMYSMADNTSPSTAPVPKNLTGKGTVNKISLSLQGKKLQNTQISDFFTMLLLLAEMVPKTMARKLVLNTQINQWHQNCTIDLYFSLAHTHGGRVRRSQFSLKNALNESLSIFNFNVY